MPLSTLRLTSTNSFHSALFSELLVAACKQQVTLNWDNYLLWNFHLGNSVLQLLSFSLQVFQTWKDRQAFLLTFQEYCNSNLTVMTSLLRLRILCQCRKLKDEYFWYFYSEMFYVAKGGMTSFCSILLSCNSFLFSFFFSFFHLICKFWRGIETY